MTTNTAVGQNCPALAPELTIHPGLLHDHWRQMAQLKGFDLVARVRDRYHLALRCRSCGQISVVRLFVLMSTRPICRHCLETARAAQAKSAGLTYLGPDPVATPYGLYRAPCGHVLRRQFEFIDRMAAGLADARCETCFAAKERRKAARLGWTRIAPDPQGNANYHLYRHRCGHVQRIARANLNWGQCDCAGCGQSWTAKPSQIYLVEIRHGPLHLLKLGYSANPQKRFRHQLGLPKEARITLLRRLRIATGHAACVLEKALHARLSRDHPGSLVPPEVYRGVLNVVSEVYRTDLAPVLHRCLDEIAAKPTGGSGSP
ncbi:GIY-YIG nuclease family protein [Paracoccus caeni]|uniref:GIY-YIG nuclease family protein n=1 Tax=Paracoccus caeni TaxID=657651 RepID=A0A934SI80_9RHOB|nr:GIY-YIG nuclease family protein [Paracoccus caeni]MBK4217945.1 GIY-YIG nuclease family protein [Paracoccus caeni]